MRGHWAPDKAETGAVVARNRLRHQLLWRDHGVLRIAFCNAAWVDLALARSNQPWPFQLKRWRRRGLRTIINLRGERSGAAYALEREACNSLGLALENFRLSSREVPTAVQIREADALFARIAYPALVYCKSGSDRAGLMSALYLLLHRGAAPEVALRQLSLRRLHLSIGRVQVLRQMLEAYAADQAITGRDFRAWAASSDYEEVRRRLLRPAGGMGQRLVDAMPWRE